MKTTNVLFRISLDDKKKLQELAKANNQTMSSFIRFKSITEVKN